MKRQLLACIMIFCLLTGCGTGTGSEITVESRVGEGSTFTLWF